MFQRMVKRVLEAMNTCKPMLKHVGHVETVTGVPQIRNVFEPSYAKFKRM